ncbi:MAG: TlpA family protein disulfide reductase [Verrucomicrobia bacterium]|nr:TlpA family protein disulfide reductase [Verrucomicrobiota bacterium]
MMRRLNWLMTGAVGIGIVAFTAGEKIRRELATTFLARAEAPSEAAFEELAIAAPDKPAFLQRMWATEKIPHRVRTLAHLNSLPVLPDALAKAASSLARLGARDPDLSVRELSLAILERTDRAACFAQAASLLRDADPYARLLGLQYLRKPAARAYLPQVVALLDDAEPKVVTAADANLRRWTSNDFGIRVATSVTKEKEGEPPTLDAVSVATIAAGVAKWKDWWRTHEPEFSTSRPMEPVGKISAARLRAADFKLQDLAGKTVRLSDFRGKTVLLNFWTTWCTACQTEMPDLIELQRRHANDLAILGVSLDGQPDEHAHDHDGETHPAKPGNDKILSQIKRVATARKLNYRVLWNPAGLIGARFNGQELPTNVLIDADGFVRRRFIGPRPIVAWEAMLAEISNPARDTTQSR